MELKLYQKDMENVNTCHFSFCDLLPSIHALELFNSLAENFKMKFMTFIAMLQIFVSLKAHA